MRDAIRSVAVVVAVGSVACGSAPAVDGFSNTGAADAGTDAPVVKGDGDSGVGTFGGGNEGGVATACSNGATQFVYVLSADNDLYRFAPDQKLFTKIGQLGCQTTMAPNSMAVDRNAVAWVNYVQTGGSGVDTAGVLYRVNTLDATCDATPALQLPPDWYRIGMGYATDGAGSAAETLYVAAVQSTVGMGLGSIDFTTNSVRSVGPFSAPLTGESAELTGTGDGRLYGFFTTSPVEVAQIDSATGATQPPVPMNGVRAPHDWAFSFWGGHFYLYTSQGGSLRGGSDVTDYDPVSGAINPAYMVAIGFDIVGAGVSTCAPVVLQ